MLHYKLTYRLLREEMELNHKFFSQNAVYASHKLANLANRVILLPFELHQIVYMATIK